MNEDLRVETLGNQLQEKSIALCVSGGIAAIEAPKLARHFRRYGAVVGIYVSPNTYEFVGKASLQWGSGKEVIDKLSGNAEHICLEDIVVVAPATLNTINKIFTGIADNALTTLVASALGMKKPVYLCPTMHSSLYENPFLKENLQKAEKYGLKIIPPRLSEGKAKLPRIDYIVKCIINDMGEKNGS